MIALGAARPGETLLPNAYRPEVSWAGPETDVTVLPDRRSVLIRNVPAGTWKAGVGRRGDPDLGKFALPPGGHARLEILLP